MSYPVLVFDWDFYPDLANNIWNAQRAGWPALLTYNGPDVTLRRAQRRSALRFEHEGLTYEIPRILSRDEYPFACTEEGGHGWVGHIPAKQNSAQGGLIAAFLARHDIIAGMGRKSRFIVETRNVLRGRPIMTIPKPRFLR